MAHPTPRSLSVLVALAGLFTGLIASTVAAAPPGPPRVSPAASVTQTVGLADLTIAYSRPSVRGRTVFGELVPYGELWRTGANEATTFAVSHDASIGGKTLPAGTYAFFTVPGEREWTLIWNSAAEQWGGFSRDAAKDVLSITAPAAKAAAQEQFLIDVPAVTADAATVSLRWAEVEVRFDVTFDTGAIALANAEAEVASGENPRAGFNWARHFLQTGTHLDRAMTWAAAAAADSPSYWTHALHARLLQARGQGDAARAAAEAAFGLVAGDRNAAAAGRDADALREEMKSW